MGFNGSFTGYMKTSFRLFYILTCVTAAVFLNTSCTSPPSEDDFGQEEGRTLHDIQQFLLSVSVELKTEGEKLESGDGKPGPAPLSPGKKTSDSSGKLQQVDWIKAPLTEEHLKELGALRIKTVSKGEPVKNSTSQEGAFVDPYSSISFINQYYRLGYEFLDVQLPGHVNMDSIKDDPKKLRAFLLGKINSFYGFPDTTYYILPHLEGNYLILYRLGKPKTIPYDQIPLARKVGDFLATPLVGYPVKYCLSEKKKNRYGETTDRSIPDCEGVSVGSAKYIQLKTDKKNKELFHYMEKLDLFPSDFFNGHWVYFKTEIQSSTGKYRQISREALLMANLVEFQKKSNYLAVVDSSQFDMDEKDRSPNLFIPVQWREYEMDQDLSFFNSFGEREKKPAKKDVERPFFQLDFQQLKNLEGAGSSNITRTVESVLVTNDILSFNIKINQKGLSPRIIRYVFTRAENNPDFPQKRWYEEDSTQFHPLFSVWINHYKRAVYHTRADQENFHRVVRFDPTREEIRWHFSTQTPQDSWVRDFGRLAIAYENRILQEAGKYSDRKIKMVLDEDSGDKELGDPRYNVINLVVTESSGGVVFSMGPTILHPLTGEVLFATANVWVSHIMDQYVRLVRKYIRFHVWPLPWKLLPSSPGVSDFLHEKIQKLCPDVGTFINNTAGVVSPLHPIQSSGVLNDGNLQVQCGRKLARVPILGTVLQAIHRGMGFRSILSASADRENYYKSYDEIEALFGDIKVGEGVSPAWKDNLTKNHREPPYYSSVMDYNLEDFPQLPVPGKYDLAATRYLYFDQLETIDDKGVVDGFVTLNSGEKSILEAINEGPVLFTSLSSGESASKKIDESKLKRYYICGGKSVYGSNRDETSGEPLCSHWDYGRTPKEVVANKIRQIKDSMMLDSRRYESGDLEPDGIYKKSLISMMVPGSTQVGFQITIDPIELQKININKFTEKWAKLRQQIFAAAERDVLDFSSFIEEDVEGYERLIQDAIQREKEVASPQQQMTEEERQRCGQRITAESGDEDIAKECEPYSEIEAYYGVLTLLAAFFKEMIFIPPKQCIYQKTEGSSVSYKTVALEVIRARKRTDHSTENLGAAINFGNEGSPTIEAPPVVEAPSSAGISPTLEKESFVNCQSQIVKDWADENNMGEWEFIGEVGVFTDDMKYFIEPLEEDPVDEYSIFNLLQPAFSAMATVLFAEPTFRKNLLQELEGFMLEGFNLNAYLNEMTLRKILGLPPEDAVPWLPHLFDREREEKEEFELNPYLNEEAVKKILSLSSTDTLPRLPRLSSHEIITVIQGAHSQQNNIMARMHVITDALASVGIRLGKVRKPLETRFQLMSEDPTELQLQISRLTEDPSQAESQMSNAYREHWPFIFQTYQRYLEEYDTPEKQQSRSFTQYFMNLPSILQFVQLEGDSRIAVPFDERGVFAEAFEKYNTYKACIEETADTCEDIKEKEGYMRLIEGAVTGRETKIE